MKNKHYSYIYLFFATIALIIVLFAYGHNIKIPDANRLKHEKKQSDQIDTINALIFYHAADYFVYQGSVIGFQYDLLKQMSRDLNIPVNINIEEDPDEAFLQCFTNQYHIVSFDFDKDFFTPMYLVQSLPHSYTYPVLIMRKKSVTDSSHVKVVHASAKYSNQIDFSELQNPQSWKLQHDFQLTTEDLFTMLEDNLIDYVVCNYNVAITMLPFYTNLKLGPRVGENFPRTWVLNSSNPKLNDKINRWLQDFQKTTKYQNLCKRYLSRHSYVIQNSFGTKRNRISSYDNCLKAASKRCGIDWRFMSAIIYQESAFSSDVLGFGGSFGIMQMMPATCRQYGISDTSSVEAQIWAGARYIRDLYRIFWPIVDSTDIYSFVASAYNAGQGHTLDAIRLCKKYGGDERHWESVSQYLLLKSHREYYSDPVVKCGYYPGKRNLHYVQEVMDRYNGFLITKKQQ